MIDREVFLAAAKALRRQGFDAIDDDNRINVTVDGTHRSVDTAEFSIWLVAEHDEKEASMVRIQAAGDVVEAQRRLRAAVGADEYVAWVDVIDETISRIAHATDLESGDDESTRIAERIVRELRQEYADVIEAGTKREAALRKTIEGIARTLAATVHGCPYDHEPVLHVSQALKLACDTIDDLRAENERLRSALCVARAALVDPIRLTLPRIDAALTAHAAHLLRSENRSGKGSGA